MAADATVMAAVKRKVNVTWEDSTTNARLEDVVGIVSPRLSSLLGYDSDHEYASTDGEAWGLFLNACLYEFSDAWDDFVTNYEHEIMSCRLLIVSAESAEEDEDEDA